MVLGLRHVLLGVAVVAVIILVVVYVSGGVQRITAGFRGETGAIERTEADGAFRVAAYEEFFGLCTAVQDAEAQIRSLEQELETGPSADRVTVIQASLTGVRSARSESINTYNSKAAQEHRSAFRDAGLPERLNHETGETECVE